jgi:sugar/nucleoside kinase (ribokinase family)
MEKRGLFIGLTTLDLIYQTNQPLKSNHKFVATDMAIAAGGPATNAAIAFQSLGNTAQVVSALGRHPLTQMVRDDFSQQGVHHADLLPDLPMPPISSIIVDARNGDRTVISRNAVLCQVDAESLVFHIPDLLEQIDIILVDGHQIPVSVAIAQKAQQHNIPVVLDGGSWKSGLEALLPWVDFAICSANFHPPECTTPDAVLTYLIEVLRQPHSAITQGSSPILYHQCGAKGTLPVQPINPIDTLGAGDAFHGAFCHWILRTDFVTALQKAAEVAAIACQSFGTRNWLSSQEG